MTPNSHEHRTDREAVHDEQSLGTAVGRAVAARVDASVPLALPSLTAVADRAATRARVRTARRTVVAVAASVLVVVGGLVGLNALNRQDTTTVLVTSDQASGPSPGTVPVAGDPQPAGNFLHDSQDLGIPIPEELSTGPLLEWTEIYPGFADLYNFKSLDSGRVIARAWAFDDELVLNAERAVYTDNGTDWTELPLPDGIVVRDIDNSGDRWLAYGRTHGSDERRDLPHVRPDFTDRIFLSEDLGATWTEVTLDIPTDRTRDASPCTRFLFVDSASLTDDGFVVDTWGYRVSDESAVVCPDVGSMRLVWSDGSTLQLPGRRTDPAVIAREYDAYVNSNGFAVSAVDDVLTVRRIDDGERVSTTATFEGLFPAWTLAAGQAGVAMTAFPSLGGQLGASTIGGLPRWRDFDRTQEPTGVHLWLGWSADGISWGWQSLPDAFNITVGEPSAGLGVGRDFVIARIETYGKSTSGEAAAPRQDTDPNEDSLGADTPAARWFIASVP